MNSSINKIENITDYIYGLISIPNHYTKFLNSFYVQRLRNILQCPTAKYVFPSVNHSCFEHSVGTYFLSNKLITDLKNRQKDLDINQTLINTISLCGLFNNIGTVPFLNSFKSFYKEKYNLEFDTKQKAFDVIENLMNTKGIDPECINNKNEDENFDLNIIKNIFTKPNNYTKFYEKIVFNPKTGIDCESFDNLIRDTYKYGDYKPSFDYNILMNSSHIIDDEICYNYENSFSIYDYYNSKYVITTKYYNHRVSTAVELMITDVYKLIDCFTPINDIINDNNKYIHFFDSFIHNIKYNEKDNPHINKAKSILNNIDKRNLYTSIGDYYLSHDESLNNFNEFDKFDKKTLIDNRNKSDVELNPDDIRIKKDIICLGSGNNDPFDNLLFYDNNYNTLKIKAEVVSKLLPYRSKSKVIRVFLTDKNQDKIKAAQNALINYKNKYKGYAYLYKSESEVKNIEDSVAKFEIGDGLLFKINEDNYKKEPTLGKKRQKDKGYNDFHEILSKKKK